QVVVRLQRDAAAVQEGQGVAVDSGEPGQAADGRAGIAHEVFVTDECVAPGPAQPDLRDRVPEVVEQEAGPRADGVGPPPTGAVRSTRVAHEVRHAQVHAGDAAEHERIERGLRGVDHDVAAADRAD